MEQCQEHGTFHILLMKSRILIRISSSIKLIPLKYPFLHYQMLLKKIFIITSIFQKFEMLKIYKFMKIN